MKRLVIMTRYEIKKSFRYETWAEDTLCILSLAPSHLRFLVSSLTLRHMKEKHTKKPACYLG